MLVCTRPTVKYNTIFNIRLLVESDLRIVKSEISVKIFNVLDIIYGAVQKLRNGQRGEGSTILLHIVTYILRGMGVLIYDIVT